MRIAWESGKTNLGDVLEILMRYLWQIYEEMMELSGRKCKEDFPYLHLRHVLIWLLYMVRRVSDSIYGLIGT